MADDVLSAGAAGSSAGGEQPKFLLARTPGPVAVLVKFSPPVRDEVSQRLADLLVCEHVALDVIRAHGRPAASSQIVQARDRIFLEVERFDRLADRGRRGLLSLTALDAEFVGRMNSWTDTAAELLRGGHIDEAALEQIQWLEYFGRLIANTDMHLSNLSFFTRGTRVTALAPAYDMSPMMYAPQHGHLIERRFHPDLPGPSDTAVWEKARRAALDFWSAASSHPLVSDGFRQVARSNASRIDSLGDIGPMLPR